MGSEWQELPLEDCMEAIIDYRGKTPTKTDSGIPLITAKIIKDGAIQQVSEYIAEEDYDSWMRRGIPRSGDIVMTTEAPLGEVAQLDDRKVALAQRVITLRGKADLLDNTYLKYLLISEYVQSQLDGRSSGTTVSGIKQSELRKVLLKFPSFEVQTQIAQILVTLDNKIALNRQINTTLESMAQALFKSWFVDFDPVIDNALAAGNEIPDALQKRAAARAARREALHQQTSKTTNKTANETTEATDAASVEQALPGTGLSDQRLPSEIQQLFPDRFVLTEEMGWVPEGWGKGKLGDFVDVKRGGSPRPIHDFLAEEGLPWVKISDATSDSSRFLMGTKQFIKREGLKKTVMLTAGELILSNSATPGLPKFLNLDACIHDGWLYFPKKQKFTNLYLYQLFLVVKDKLLAQGNGSVFTNLKTDILKSLPVLVPPIGVIEQVTGVLRSLHERSLFVQSEIEVLSNLRDSLLPKLLSGQLTIPDAEQQLAEVL